MPRRGKAKSLTSSVAPERMSSFDKLVEKRASAKRQVRTGNGTVEMTLEEAVFERLTQKAIEGSPQALRQWIEHNRCAAEKRAAEVAEDISIWSAYKVRKYAEIEAHRKAHLPEPLVLPHPDDVEIDEQTGVTIVGPLNREEYDAAVQTQRFIDAVLLQEALDRRKGKCADAPAPGLGDPLTTVLIVNKSLGNRMAYSNEQLIDRRMCLAGLSIRDLERETFHVLPP